MMFKNTVTGMLFVALIGSRTVMADYALWDWGFNVDGSTEVLMDGGDPASFGQDLVGFDDRTGAGTVTFDISGTGSHNVDAFFDIELNETFNTWWNETASQGGSMSEPAGTAFSWEVDEPGFAFGNIVDNLYVSDFDKAVFPDLTAYETDNFLDQDGADDVAVGMGWDFILAEDQTAMLTFSVSETFDVNSGMFYLLQKDNSPNEDGVIESLYFTSSLVINGGPTAVPEPTAMSMLLSAGFLFIGMFFINKKRGSGR